MANSTHQILNRLAQEKSPYLQQHANNPVNWWPWCDEALAQAHQEDKPIFLSIGYSTCHWCHVMARESFASEEVAELLNQSFIAIKVDREERPDIDAVYMRACQALTGSGGWPLTIIMTPEQKPFFAATYLPKTTYHGMMGMMELLPSIAGQWQTNRPRLIAASEEITAFIDQEEESANKIASPASPTDIINLAVHQFTQSFDKTWGGFGRAPKFPSAHNLLFLLKYAQLNHDEHAQTMIEVTLEQMYRGGIFDHLGGGFSRYSTDKKWLIPHFEKMLYDNALLAETYLEASKFTGKELYQKIAQRILDYTLRELTDRDGGFYCGQDADSDGVEGKYYAFSYPEILHILGDHAGEKFCRFYDITESGNFEGKNIPNLIENPDYASPGEDIIEMRDKLYQYRLQRTSLHKDDKILTSWNALMIMAMAKADPILTDNNYLAAAQKAQQFIEHNLTEQDGRLHIRWREGEAAFAGLLDDYALYGLSLLTLSSIIEDDQYLQRAITIAEIMEEQFADQHNGGFYLTAKDAQPLIMRPKEIYDGALPSGNSAAALFLTRLANFTGDGQWEKRRDAQIKFILPRISQYPISHGYALLALLELQP